jgi:hypothetical protein
MRIAFFFYCNNQVKVKVKVKVNTLVHSMLVTQLLCACGGLHLFVGHSSLCDMS